MCGWVYIVDMFDFIDAHCHYDPAAFYEYSGRGQFVCNAITPDDWTPLINASRRNPKIFAAIGIHPWRAKKAYLGDMAYMADTLANNPHLMVGEIGLDNMHQNRETQYSLFRSQYEMAAAFNRTAHIHCVRAWGTMLPLLRTVRTPPAVLFHRFVGTPDLIADICDATDNRAYFSFCALGNPATTRLVEMVPLNRIVLETDKAQPNPNRMACLITECAKIYDIRPAEMARILYNNTLRMIKNGQTAQNS